MQEKKRINWRQACALLGCSRSHFYRLVNSGELPAFRVGRRGLWVYEADCRELLRPVADDALDLKIQEKIPEKMLTV